MLVQRGLILYLIILVSTLVSASAGSLRVSLAGCGLFGTLIGCWLLSSLAADVVVAASMIFPIQNAIDRGSRYVAPYCTAGGEGGEAGA